MSKTKKTSEIVKKKGKERIVMLTAYDYSFAHILDDTEIDIILVGDSLANVVLGEKYTKYVSIREMLSHTQAVARAVKNKLVVADMPYLSYQKDPRRCDYYACQFLKKGADAVKVEWFKRCPEVVKKLIQKKIPVMGHIGLTPQTVDILGGYKRQGVTKSSAKQLLKQAKYLESLGVFSLVIEFVPEEVAFEITSRLKIPTIGIFSGKKCDGEVLVLYDMLGLYPQPPKLAKCYLNLNKEIKKAVDKFCQEVRGKV